MFSVVRAGWSHQSLSRTLGSTAPFYVGLLTFAAIVFGYSQYQQIEFRHSVESKEEQSTTGEHRMGEGFPPHDQTAVTPAAQNSATDFE